MHSPFTLPFIWNVFRSYRFGEVVTVDDPWGNGNSLEWATSCPPPRHNFTEPLSAPSVRRSRCTTHTWWNGFGLKLTPEGPSHNEHTGGKRIRVSRVVRKLRVRNICRTYDGKK